MKWTRKIVIVCCAMAVAGFGAVVIGRILPLGIPGQWTWPMIVVRPRPIDMILAGCGIGLYIGFAAIGFRGIHKVARMRESLWVAGLVMASVMVQLAVHSGAPDGFGLTKWVSVAIPGSSGYFDVAKSRAMADPWRFWSEYPVWIQKQDALHVGTHPPGLFLASRAALGVMNTFPSMASSIAAMTPESVVSGFRFLIGETPVRERSAVVLIAILTLVSCSLTVAPLYLLARFSLPAQSSWVTAAIWPLIPSAILFQPTADTAFPFIATSALALAVWGGPLRSILAGILLGIGMQFTLAFLPVGLAVAFVLLGSNRDRRKRVADVAWTGAGFLGVTIGIWLVSGANPWVIWWWNQKNHARFYEQYPRSYGAWVAANPVELAVAIGLPTSIFAAIGFGSRTAPRSAWIGVLVLAVLNFSGKNLSEVARLWLPFMPMLLAAAGAGFEKIEGNARTLGVILMLLAIQTLMLQSTIQVVYPLFDG